MNIKSESEFKKIITEQVLYPLLKTLSNEIVKKVRDRLKEYSSQVENISTRTMQEYTTFSIQKTSSGYSTTIFINDEQIQQAESWENPTGNGYNRFMSLNLDVAYNGKNIAWHMINWLENGTRNLGGNSANWFGNQPIEYVGMFHETYLALYNELPIMIEGSLKKSGLKLLK